MKSTYKVLKVSLASFTALTGISAMTIPQVFKPTYAQVSQLKDVQTKNLINPNTEWKYLDNNTDAGNANDRTVWTKGDYDDSNWNVATGKFGAKKGAMSDLGSGYIPTVLLNQYINGTGGDVIPTYFFRTNVNIESLEDLSSLTGTLVYDDAAILYINGQEVASFDKPDGGFETNMSYGGSNAATPKVGNINLSLEQLKDVLVAGNNTIAIELHNGRASSSDIYLEVQDLTLTYGEEKSDVEQKGLNLTVGLDETQMNMTWYANTSSGGEVQFVEASQLINGEFPTSYQLVEATKDFSNDAGFSYYQATLEGLKENTKYAYRVVNEDKVSEIYYLTTKDFDGSFNFILAGDPQIGASGNATNDTNGWDETLASTVKKFNPNFILSAGDQVNTANNESQYAGYLNHDELTSVPQATTVGNHDSGSNSYSQHFNLPNVSDKGKTTASGDYWYVYNNTLIMDINSNNMSTAEHEAFLKEAIEKNPDVRWKVVTFHHSVYSVASHAVESDILQRREQLTPVFDKLGIDVVLMGHDHVYVRSHIMKDQQISQNTDGLTSITDPDGILYITANSASGSKFYNIKSGIDTSYAARQDQSKQKSVSNIEVSENEFKVTTYNYDANSDDWKQIDEFAIKKTAENVDTGDTDNPTDSEKPSNPSDTEKPNVETPKNNENSNKSNYAINTGDNTDLFAMSIAAISSVLGLGIVVKRRKKESE